MALRSAAALLKGAVLARVSVPVSSSAAGALAGRRWFAAADVAAKGTYLDKDEVTERVIKVVKGFPKVDSSKITPHAHFVNDLGLDSLDTVEVVMAFEEEFAIEIPDAEADKMGSTADAIAYISSHPQAK
eukprot:jgi/Chlat1/3732/Chrsp259S03884